MTTTPKELLAAAVRLSQRSWTAIDADESVLARHILATVRADDDELVALEWFEAQVKLTAHGSVYFYKCGKMVAFVEPGLIRTRGQFRAICRVLGITLPEVPHE